MDAAILAVGSELLQGDRIDTNSVRLAGLLRQFGVETVAQVVVADDEARLAAEVRHWAESTPLVILGGGLGPTIDDRTRRAVARGLELGISRDRDLLETLRARHTSRGSVMTAVAEQQADVVEGARVLENRWGSAPGQQIEWGASTLFLFPGVPRELDAMVDAHLLPWLRSQDGLKRRGGPVVFRVADRGESRVEQVLRPIWDSHPEASIIILASPAEVEIRADGDDEALVQEVRAALGGMAHSEGERTLAGAVGELLVGRGETLATAESCTGGLVGGELTKVAGSSRWFVGGVVSYSNEVKTSALDVPASLIEEHGAVSEEVAVSMAEGARKRLGSDWAVALTGVAGPGGGTPTKPVGTVVLGLVGPEGGEARTRQFTGDREVIRRKSVVAVLEWLRRSLVT